MDVQIGDQRKCIEIITAHSAESAQRQHCLPG